MAAEVQEEKEISRWDVVYGPKEYECHLEPHFCREWDDKGGCYGTNPDHGFTWEDARAEVSKFYERLSKEWATKNESEYYG